MKKLFSSVSSLLIFLFLLVCSKQLLEVKRIPNASRSIDAVIAIVKTGATVATPTEIYIVPKGGATKGEPILRADNVEELLLI